MPALIGRGQWVGLPIQDFLFVRSLYIGVARGCAGVLVARWRSTIGRVRGGFISPWGSPIFPFCERLGACNLIIFVQSAAAKNFPGGPKGNTR